MREAGEETGASGDEAVDQLLVYQDLTAVQSIDALLCACLSVCLWIDEPAAKLCFYLLPGC